MSTPDERRSLQEMTLDNLVELVDKLFLVCETQDLELREIKNRVIELERQMQYREALDKRLV